MRRICLPVLAVALSACSQGPETPKAAQKPANVTAARLLNATSEPSQWLTYNGDYNEQRFSRLDKIDIGNVADLGLAWYADFPTNLPVEGSPLYIDGVIYQPLPWSKVVAYDARTGAQLWLFDPEGGGRVRHQYLLWHRHPRPRRLERQDHRRHARRPSDRR